MQKRQFYFTALHHRMSGSTGKWQEKEYLPQCFRKYYNNLTLSKAIFRILGFGFLTVDYGFIVIRELGFRIPIVNRFAYSLSCIPYSGFHKQKFPRFRNPNFLKWSERNQVWFLVLVLIRTPQSRLVAIRWYLVSRTAFVTTTYKEKIFNRKCVKWGKKVQLVYC